MKVANVEIADSDANPVPTLYTEALLRTRSLGHSPGRALCIDRTGWRAADLLLTAVRA